jgi:hypothetical protein
MKALASFVSIVIAVPLAGCIATEGMAEDVMDYESREVRPLGSTEEVLNAPQTPEHCVIEATVVSGDENDFPLAASAPRCFQTFSDAVHFATEGRVQLPLGATPDDLDETVLRGGQVTPMATYVIGVEYKDTDGTGSSVTFTSTLPCEGGYIIGSSYMPAGWNDVISSARAFSGCNHSYHYEETFMEGAVADCGTYCSYIGHAMNDRTSSILWKP